MTFTLMGCVKDGQPVCDSNFSDASKRTVSQQRQEYIPGSKRLHISELKARSVPACRVTWYSSSLSCSRHSASVLTTLRSGAGLPLFAKIRTSCHLSIISCILGAEPEAVPVGGLGERAVDYGIESECAA